jgi:hypothetical protein
VSIRALAARLDGLGRRVVAGAAVVALFTGAWCAPVAAANWLEKTIYLWGPKFDSELPACDNSWAIGTIQRRFATKEDRFWNSDLTIQSIEQVKEVAFRPWADGTVPRRFCTGRALTSDGKWHTVRYSIIEDGGMIGASWGVQWCVVGLDRNWAYNPACRAARP